jgi:glutaredoxin
MRTACARRPFSACTAREFAADARGRYRGIVILYTCPDGKSVAGGPGPLAHPCWKAAKALDNGGHSYETKQVKGGIVKPWTWASRSRDRAEIKQLSGQTSVPILVLDDGNVVTGSGAIVRWAQGHAPRSPSTA